MDVSNHCSVAVTLSASDSMALLRSLMLFPIAPLHLSFVTSACRKQLRLVIGSIFELQILRWLERDFLVLRPFLGQETKPFLTGCCFVKYATSDEADRAIRALHNQYTLPGVGTIPIYCAAEDKLFVASLNKLANAKEIEEVMRSLSFCVICKSLVNVWQIFSPYGRVEDVYLMRDSSGQSRGRSGPAFGGPGFSPRSEAALVIRFGYLLEEMLC
ncbi:hypothetical protein BHE74_00010479 [Ensete ventricosum]|nr:hypothetical protein BHE74_00010479 [Ensete ventricosum]